MSMDIPLGWEQVNNQEIEKCTFLKVGMPIMNMKYRINFEYCLKHSVNNTYSNIQKNFYSRIT